MGTPGPGGGGIGTPPFGGGTENPPLDPEKEILLKLHFKNPNRS